MGNMYCNMCSWSKKEIGINVQDMCTKIPLGTYHFQLYVSLLITGASGFIYS